MEEQQPYVTSPQDSFDAEGDKLAEAGDRAALEYGWWAVNWIKREAHRAGEKGGTQTGRGQETYPDSRADPDSRAAFTFALTELEGRHGKSLSRSQITDRIRIGRAFPKDVYGDLVEELHYRPTFSQLRAAFVKDDPDRTMELLLWAAEHDAKPQEINAEKMGGEPETEEERTWRKLAEWADKYMLRAGDLRRERYRLAREIVERDRLDRQATPKKEV